MLYVFLQTLLIIGFIVVLALGLIKTMKEMPCEIAVYSGSFNPLHIGHKTVIDTLSKKFDWVYLIVTPQNPLKDKIIKSSEERIKDAENALRRNEYFNVIANEIESEMMPPYYTVNTLRELKKKNPLNNYTLAIGADNLTNIKEWFMYQEILLDFGVVVFPRGTEDIEYLENLKYNLLKENPKYKITIEHIITPNISSTEIRNALEKGDDVHHLLM